MYPFFSLAHFLSRWGERWLLLLLLHHYSHYNKWRKEEEISPVVVVVVVVLLSKAELARGRRGVRELGGARKINGQREVELAQT